MARIFLIERYSPERATLIKESVRLAKVARSINKETLAEIVDDAYEQLSGAWTESNVDEPTLLKQAREGIDYVRDQLSHH